MLKVLLRSRCRVSSSAASPRPAAEAGVIPSMEQDWAAFGGPGPESDVLHCCRPTSWLYSCTAKHATPATSSMLQTGSSTARFCGCRWGRTVQGMGTRQVRKLRILVRTGEVAETGNQVADKGEATLAEADVAELALGARGSAGHFPTCSAGHFPTCHICQQLQLQPAPNRISLHPLHLEALHLLQHLWWSRHHPLYLLLLRLLLYLPATKL